MDYLFNIKGMVKMCNYGICCGKDATVAAIDDFSIAFLRIKEDVIASILKHRTYGTVSKLSRGK